MSKLQSRDRTRKRKPNISSKNNSVFKTLGVKYDGIGTSEPKPRWNLLPWDVIEQVTKILTMGAEKYADDNWKYVPDAKERYISALQRHFMSYWKSTHGSTNSEESYDNESGLNHLFHLLCCGIFLAWFEMQEGKTEKPKIEKVENQ